MWLTLCDAFGWTLDEVRLLQPDELEDAAAYLRQKAQRAAGLDPDAGQDEVATWMPT